MSWTTSGVTYTFLPGSKVGPEKRFLLARSPREFRNRYTERNLPQVFGPYTGKLANEGEEISISDAGRNDYPARIDILLYDNQGDWPTANPGQSLELKASALHLDNDNPDHWELSPGTPGGAPILFIRGDSNGDELVDLSDPIFTLQYLFSGGETPGCLDAADANDDSVLDISDSILLLFHLFQGAEPPPAPYPDPGSDPTQDTLSCGQ